jgi:IS4 transposase
MFKISRFHALIKPISPAHFNQSVARHRADKHSKGFSCWDQLIAMLYAQLSGAQSLRQLEAGFNSQYTHHYPLGVSSIRRSTLADANHKRPAAVFADTARTLMALARRPVRKEVDEVLYLIDSTSLTLSGPGFDAWTQQPRTRNTQGMKLHVLLEAGTAEAVVPCAASLTMANVNDITEAVKLPLQQGARYVFDKGYCDYTWWARLDRAGAHFVTRFKRNAALRVEQSLPIAEAAASVILADEIVRLSNRHPGAKRRNPYTQALWRITVRRPDNAKPLVLATNDLTSDALTIAAHYQARWRIELYFKWIKQHLRIKQFLGRSENAVRIQVLTALIAYLLLTLLRQRQGDARPLWTLLGEVRATLFQRPQLDALHYRRRQEQRSAFAQLQPQLL